MASILASSSTSAQLLFPCSEASHALCHPCIWKPSPLERTRALHSRSLGFQGFRVCSNSLSRASLKAGGKVSTFVDLTTYTVPEKSIHEFIVQDIDGNNIDLSKYRGTVLLVVNVASHCPLTIQNYRELVELHRRYRNQGFEILAFPCNQFGRQEPSRNEAIKRFATTKFHVKFPLFQKVNVNGPQSVPLYKYLRIMKGDTFPGDQIKWNFAKFLVNKDGIPVARYIPTCSPFQIEPDIKLLLGTP